MIESGSHLNEQSLSVQKVASEFGHQEEDCHGMCGDDAHDTELCLFQGRRL